MLEMKINELDLNKIERDSFPQSNERWMFKNFSLKEFDGKQNNCFQTNFGKFI